MIYNNGKDMKRYQVFVSSTYTDLKNERAAVLKSILKLNCFPAGMELFPSASVEQFEYIKKLIDGSDYYILVIGARYGEVRDGISFTEKEFDYAVSKNIPILAFLHEHPEDIPAKHFELDELKRQKLDKFREKVQDNRLVSFWNNSDELSAKVILSLENAISTIPRCGWEPALSESNIKIFNENTLLKEKNSNLIKRINRLEKELAFFNSEHIKNFNDTITIKGTHKNKKDCSFTITLKKLFLLWYPHVLDIQIDIQAKQYLEKDLEKHNNLVDFTLDQESYEMIKSIFSSMGVLAEFSQKMRIGYVEQIVVTNFGKSIWNTFD